MSLCFAGWAVCPIPPPFSPLLPLVNWWLPEAADVAPTEDSSSTNYFDEYIMSLYERNREMRQQADGFDTAAPVERDGFTPPMGLAPRGNKGWRKLKTLRRELGRSGSLTNLWHARHDEPPRLSDRTSAPEPASPLWASVRAEQQVRARRASEEGVRRLEDRLEKIERLLAGR